LQLQVIIFYVLFREKWVVRRTMMKKGDCIGWGRYKEYTTKFQRPLVMMEKALWLEKA
jgi:hypothetical protein